jgi:hypothetical protein
MLHFLSRVIQLAFLTLFPKPWDLSRTNIAFTDPTPSSLHRLQSLFMRLPGTWNLGGRNDLPTAELLKQYQDLKLAKRVAKNAVAAEDDATNNHKSKVKSPHVAQNDKNNDRATDSNEKDGDTDFTAAQDKALIDLKIACKSWKDIALELGKDQSQIKARWKQIQPKHFDQKVAEAKKKAGIDKANANKNKEGVEGGDKSGNEGDRKQGKKGKGSNGQDGGGGVTNRPSTSAMEPDEYWTRKDVSSLTFGMPVASFNPKVARSLAGMERKEKILISIRRPEGSLILCIKAPKKQR